MHVESRAYKFTSLPIASDYDLKGTATLMIIMFYMKDLNKP